MSNSQQPSNILKILDNYDIVIYDVENVNPNKKLLVLESNKGKVLMQKYKGTSKQLWLAYNVFKTLKGNDVLKISDWFTTSDGAPFLESDGSFYYLTKYNDTKLTTEISLVDHMAFLGKWHYLSREIVYAKDFADSLTTPENIANQLKAISVKKNVESLKSTIIDNLNQLNLYDYPEKKLTITLPKFNINRIVKEEEQCVFQPWQQIFIWNWQITDIANLLCFFKYDKTENIKEALNKYNHLNPLSEAEWRALPTLLLWNLCTEVNYDLVCDSYFDVYNTLCNIVIERGININDRIILPLNEEEVSVKEEDELLKYPDINENVNIVVVKPIEENIENEKIIQFSKVKAHDEVQSEHLPPESQIVEPPVAESIEKPKIELEHNNTTPEEQQELVLAKNEDNQNKQEKTELEQLTWKAFPQPLNKQ
ncbi:hypothetical protein IMX26_02115 [Clostridium sp. 'deep sea']|uniref:hypothetical protein n=1 Tax=Clostridium sp. 'deep sea' TaxID=2779445 RepID=UPI0018964773|nr:hypothetical protein [Clostridium sp. 'deep sea']QOR35646.1 hypothetical protein IMX26_02115 [Clostridium sp. 'deep sea']